ncbi:MAG: type II CAAX prenyl endopeptidase Rce1 family protein [bacterium]
MKVATPSNKVLIRALVLIVLIAVAALLMNISKFELRYYLFPAMLIFAPLIFESSFKPKNIWKPTKKGVSFFLFALLAVLILYPPAFFIYWVKLNGLVFIIPEQEALLKALSKGLLAVLVAAIPEEFFFRGYLQEHVFKHLKRKIFKIITTKNLVTSALFGLIHAVTFLDITRATTFFPSLLFGFFAEKSEGKIFYSTLFHVISNILAFVLWTFIK